MVLPRSTTANEQQYIYNFLLAMPVNSTTLSLLFDDWRDNLIDKCKPNELSAKIAATCKTKKESKLLRVSWRSKQGEFKDKTKERNWRWKLKAKPPQGSMDWCHGDKARRPTNKHIPQNLSVNLRRFSTEVLRKEKEIRSSKYHSPRHS